MLNTLRIGGLTILVACFAVSALADEKGGDEKTADKVPSDNKPAAEKKTHTVERGPFKVEVELSGVLEAAKTAEVRLQPEVWSSLKVEKAVDEGTVVEQGEPILWLETEKLDEQIREVSFSRELGYLSLKQAEIALQALEKSVPLDLESVERSQRISAEDLDYFLKVDEQQKKRSAEENLKNAKYNLEYSQEEFDQLEQMYKADDLTEETEEIILKRAQRDVERGKFFLESARLRHDRALEYLLPREKQQVQDAAVRAKLNLAKTEATLPTTLQMKRIELEKLQHAQQQLEEKLAFLQADRELMVVEAPAAGVVYYGEADRGTWSSAASIRKSLRPGGSLSANAVIMTIVTDGPSFVRVDVSEDQYRYFRKGTPATVKPTAFPEETYSGRCGALNPVAVKQGTFDGRVFYDAPQGASQPVVGMTCKVVLVPRSEERAIAIPSTAVFEDESDSGRHYVYLDDEEEPRKQPVEVGEKHKGKTEILSGLNEGDKILLEKP